MRRWLSRAEEAVAGTLLVVGLGLCLYGVVMRYFVNQPQAWVEEVYKYCVIWGVLIGGAAALRHKKHIAVDVLYAVLPARGKKTVNVLANVIGLVFSVLFLVFSLQLVLQKYGSGQVSMDVGIPLWIVYLVLPLTGLLLARQFAENAVAAWRQSLDELKHDIVPQEAKEALAHERRETSPARKGENACDADAV
ncbi:TRAP transporter small permease [Calditerricola satsumensis]|uniref:Tripartite ATP-independent periplasmic transporters DctQ component domain-containing protein n=1 Tax=Calditerricola satsumensis TaxID=373054 RepID=A0A8J3BG39_9BACI|nr:TRAP transporter small permease [Calditerricola satsumensis]GGK08040.1 hypothetical protein GCM10007043_22620 [Calditerricola satsumensis]